MKKIFVLTLLLTICQWSHAQIVGTYKKVEVGLGAGITQYSGDVAYTHNLLNTRFGGEGYLRFNFNPIWACRFNVGGYFLSGWDKNSSDAFQKSRNYAFNSLAADASILLEYNFFNFRDRKNPYPKFSPYLFGGVGMAGFWSYTNSQIIEDAEGEGPYQSSSVIIPFGVGIKFPINQRFNWAIEFRSTKTFTDEIDMLGDDTYTRYTGTNNPRPELAGNNAKRDMYYYVGVSVSYRFITLKCPKDYPEPFDF